MGRHPRVARAHIHEVALTSVGPCSFSPYSALCGTDGSIGWTRGLFLDWTSADFGDGERLGNGELSEDNSSSVDRSMSLGTTTSLPLSGRDGGGQRGGPRDVSAWQASNRVHKRSLSSCNWFACSRNSATSLACSSCLAFIS